MKSTEYDLVLLFVPKRNINKENDCLKKPQTIIFVLIQ